MPKHEKGTPKEIANRCKSKGLQKLKWFCQMCQKQCRDQNGFKCHLTSESHQRQLLLFAENQNSYLRQFSREFEGNFMHILRHTFGTKRIRANEVYQEYIKDKGHVHMNSTVWHTLTGFILYLGSSGKCKIDENEKGWHIQYIDQEEEIRRAKLQQRAKAEKSDEERMQELMQRQIERAQQEAEKEAGEGEEETRKGPKEFTREEGDEQVIKFSLASKLSTPTAGEAPGPSNRLVGATSALSLPTTSTTAVPSPRLHPSNLSLTKPPLPSNKLQTSRRSALDELRAEEEALKERRNRKDYWLAEGIVVKIVTKKLGAVYYKAKGRVVHVADDDKYSAQVELEDGTRVKVDQQHVETVIPAVGREMLIVNGGYRGERAMLEKILEDKFVLQLRISKGTRAGRVLEVAYEDASKAC